ncbi:MAG: hypothetical protein LBG92_06240 [Prevotellaceae bacterium]|jgi:hypothetical protein|nr:hypothetical protein [Prevotellaceae bacterium]
MKNICKNIITASIIALFAIACSEEVPEPAAPVTPEFSVSQVTVEAGKSVMVRITKGTPKYTIVSSSSSVATATVYGDTVTVEGIAEGSANLTVSGSDGGKASITVNVTAPSDPYEQFKADETPRFETDEQKTVKNMEGEYLFYFDAGGNLFSSAKTKTGYASRDGKTFYFIEWEGDTAQGEKSNPTLRTDSVTVGLQYLRILQVKNGKIWITYKIPDSDEGKAVQNVE